MTGKALVHSEFEAILYELHEAQAANDRRKSGEPIDPETANKVITAHLRLSYMARVLLGGALLLAGLVLLIKFTHPVAQTIHDLAHW